MNLFTMTYAARGAGTSAWGLLWIAGVAIVLLWWVLRR